MIHYCFYIIIPKVMILLLGRVYTFSVKNEAFIKHPGEFHNRGYLKQALIYFINHDYEAPQGAKFWR